MISKRIHQKFESRTDAFPHQIEAINYLNEHSEVALFDEQGLGKTKIVIDSICASLKEGAIEGALVVCPMSLLFNWEQEVKKHSFLLPIVLRGAKKEKRYRYLTDANIYITNYEAVIAELDRIRRFCKSRKIAIILDESARIKNPFTKTAKSLFTLRPLSVRRIIITGTPIANKPLDLWSQYYFLDGGALLGNDFKEFKAKYNERETDYEELLSELKAKIKAHSIRRTKKEVLELPDKTFVNIYVELTGEQRELYNKLREELKIEVQDMDGNRIVDESENILKKLLRLMQIASNPLLVDKGYTETNAKFDKLEKLLIDITQKEEKAIVWTCFVDNIVTLKHRLKIYNPLVIYGDISMEDRARVVITFQDSNRNSVLIANPAAAREGLTLTRANNAIYIDRNFNLIDYLQSQDRIHRISQTKECKIYKLLARETIDEYIDQYIDVKKDIAGFVQDDIAAINSRSIEFLNSKSEILKILG